MKTFKILAMAAIGLSFARVAAAQTCDSLYWGTKTLYKAQQQTYTPTPKGYKVVFINHVGRHGARHLTKDIAGTRAWRLLHQADSLAQLTPQGKQLLGMVILLQREELSGLKNISARGAAELKGIGQRMRQQNVGLFDSPKADITVDVTKEERTRQSADAFLKGMQWQHQPDFMVNNTDLRFFSLAQAYKNFIDTGKWTGLRAAYAQQVAGTDFGKQVALRFFTPSFVASLDSDALESFADDVYGFSTIVPSVQEEVKVLGYQPKDINIRALLGCVLAQKMDLLNNVDEFLTKGPGINIDGVQVRDAVPLLVKFINTADANIAGDKLAACLRFAHAETIAPFAALLRLHGACQSVKQLNGFEKTWSAARVMPLSANIQWVFYTDKLGHCLIKILYNERETAIEGLKTNTFPYYQWQDVRGFYLKYLQAHSVKLTDNMDDYLANLK